MPGSDDQMWAPPPIPMHIVDEKTAAMANPKQAYGDKKPALHLVPPILGLRAAVAFREGARKYGPFNWRDKKVEVMTYVGAILRHMAAYVDGEELDPDSQEGKQHLDGVAASLAILLDAIHGGFAIDNRPAKGPSPACIKELTR